MGCTYLLHSDAHVFITDRDLHIYIIVHNIYIHVYNFVRTHKCTEMLYMMGD